MRRSYIGSFLSVHTLAKHSRLESDTVCHNLEGEKPARLTTSGCVSDCDYDNDTFTVSILQSLTDMPRPTPLTIRTAVALPLYFSYAARQLPYVGTVVMFSAELVVVDRGIAVVENEDYTSFHAEGKRDSTCKKTSHVKPYQLVIQHRLA